MFLVEDDAFETASALPHDELVVTLVHETTALRTDFDTGTRWDQSISLLNSPKAGRLVWLIISSTTFFGCLLEAKWPCCF